MGLSIDFSAQFGGRDAAAAVLPHFKALKRAARQTPLSGFPFSKLAFILRVDGEVSSFGFTGANHIDIDKEGDYVSVDIGIDRMDRDQLGHDTAHNVIVEAITTSVSLLRNCGDVRLSEATVNFDELSKVLQLLCKRYVADITD